MFFIKNVFLISIFLFFISVSAEIDLDYYLRSPETEMENGFSSKHSIKSSSHDEINISVKNFKDLISMFRRRPSEDDDEKLDEKEIFEERPALRHHIAHFCPNLEVARTCIRTCMKVGKPAFCGKDHVCYCGHKYSHHDEDLHEDPDDVYAQFRDLYTKYFGPGPSK